MLFRAPGYSGSTCRSHRPALHAAALILFAPFFSLSCTIAILAPLAGCGNGIQATAAPQATPASPTASALGPQLGYLWVASDRTLRPILGVPGASQIGQSVVPAGIYITAVTSATAKLAILQAADGSVELLSLPSGPPVGIGLTLATGAKFRLSPSAFSAVAFVPGSTSASLLTGLPSTPRIQTVSALSVIADAAVSDSGSVAFESARGLSVAAMNGSTLSLATLGAPGGMSFLPGGLASHDDLLFADSAANSLTIIRSATSNPASQIISTSSLLQTPSAVGVSGSGRWALVANAGSQTAVRVDLSSASVSSIACVCQPTLAEPLADDGAFRVTSLASGPNWLINTAPAAPLSLFIPALPASTPAAALASAARP